jgi:hypothetical protein
MQDFDEQIYLRKVISKNDPWNLENYLQLVTLYSGRDNLVEAKKVLSKMIKLSSASEQTKLAQTIVDNK